MAREMMPHAAAREKPQPWRGAAFRRQVRRQLCHDTYRRVLPGGVKLSSTRM